MDKNHHTVAQKKQPLPAALYLLQLAAIYRITDTRPSSFASPAFAGFAKCVSEKNYNIIFHHLQVPMSFKSISSYVYCCNKPCRYRYFEGILYFILF